MQDAGGVALGLGEGGGYVGDPGAGDGDNATDAAGRSGVAVGHEPGALFVAAEDVLDFGAEQRIVDLNAVDPGYPEDRVNPAAL